MRNVVPCLLAMSYALTAGCSAKEPVLVEVSGIVTYRGQAVPVGSIKFVPADVDLTSLRPAIGTLDANGVYQLRAFPNTVGAMPGNYLISITAYTGSIMDGTAKSVIPQRYAVTQTSGLAATIPSGAREPLKLDFDLRD